MFLKNYRRQNMVVFHIDNSEPAILVGPNSQKPPDVHPHEVKPPVPWEVTYDQEGREIDADVSSDFRGTFPAPCYPCADGRGHLARAWTRPRLPYDRSCDLKLHYVTIHW